VSNETLLFPLRLALNFYAAVGSIFCNHLCQPGTTCECGWYEDMSYRDTAGARRCLVCLLPVDDG
jgi:hypothetical protein